MNQGPSWVHKRIVLGSAYTPGLTVSKDIVVRRTRRLPIKGEVLVKVGDKVDPNKAVARAMLPGLLQTVKVSDMLGVEAKEIKGYLQVKEGDGVSKGQLVAQTPGILNRWFKQSAICDFDGTVESISELTGSMLVREAPIPVDISAYIQGTVADIMADEGAIVETRGAMVQGIFGVGGERHGSIRVATSSPSEVLDVAHIKADDAGKILVGGSGVTQEALARATEVGVIGIVVGGVKDSDLISFLGYDIGVAITGQENIGLTLVVTEGFGYLNMADRTFSLLKSIEGQSASINGATQIRAGVIRPELIAPNEAATGDTHVATSGQELGTGASIRIIREPYFGLLGTVTDLPAQLVVLESGTEVRVLKAKLETGEEVTVPRANIEIIAT